MDSCFFKQQDLICVFVCLSQHPKVRNVFNLDFPDSNHLAKTLTIVSGPDMVNLTYHNFFASKEKVTQVIIACWLSVLLALFPSSAVYNPPFQLLVPSDV